MSKRENHVTLEQVISKLMEGRNPEFIWLHDNYSKLNLIQDLTDIHEQGAYSCACKHRKE